MPRSKYRHKFELRAYFHPESRVNDIKAFMNSFRLTVTNKKNKKVQLSGPLWQIPTMISGVFMIPGMRQKQIFLHADSPRDLGVTLELVGQESFSVEHRLVYEVAMTHKEGGVWVLLTKVYEPVICPYCGDPLLPDEDQTYSPLHVSCHFGE